MDYKSNFELWAKNVKDKKVLEELSAMTESQKEQAFFKDIEFGTAGLRGIVGIGSNMMNVYTVGRVSKAVALYMEKINAKSIAIAYDSRDMSPEFAKLAAKIFAYHRIKVYLTKTMMPTPYLSFMVRYFKCNMGINITASHNPKDYNGYKVYDNTGCQLLEEPSYKIMEIAENLSYFDVKMASFSKAVDEKTIVVVDEENSVFEAYIKAVKKQSLHKIKNITAVYTALNGAGIKTLPRVLEDQGAKLIFNKVQCKPDKNFTTCPYPNPEIDSVYDTSMELAKDKNVDLILASDPDADRIGVCVNQKGKFIHLTGNEIGVLLTDYLFSNRKENGGILVKSIVSTKLAEKLVENYGGKTKNVLTGFKYIGEFVRKLETESKEKDFVLGFEESSGYLSGSYVRDKDATLGCMLIAEAASELKKQGKTLYDRLIEIYDKYGYYQSKTISFEFDGVEGQEKMQKILSGFRSHQPKEFAGFKVKNIIDYQTGFEDLPKANVIEYDLEHGKQIIIRPSGTEPKIKVYLTVADSLETNKKSFELLINEFSKLME